MVHGQDLSASIHALKGPTQGFSSVPREFCSLTKPSLLKAKLVLTQFPTPVISLLVTAQRRTEDLFVRLITTPEWLKQLLLILIAAFSLRKVGRDKALKVATDKKNKIRSVSGVALPHNNVACDPTKRAHTRFRRCFSPKQGQCFASSPCQRTCLLYRSFRNV